MRDAQWRFYQCSNAPGRSQQIFKKIIKDFNRTAKSCHFSVMVVNERDSNILGLDWSDTLVSLTVIYRLFKSSSCFQRKITLECSGFCKEIRNRIKVVRPQKNAVVYLKEHKGNAQKSKHLFTSEKLQLLCSSKRVHFFF